MVEEMTTLKKNDTLELVSLPDGMKWVQCKWLFTVKHNADGTIDNERYKLDVKNAFYMEIWKKRYIWMFHWVFHKSHADHTVSSKRGGDKIIIFIFLGIEVARSDRGFFLSKKKYILDLLEEETVIFGCRLADSSIGANHHLSSAGKPVDKERNQRRIGILIYLSHTRLDILHMLCGSY
ncbi:uncharacterized protein LOC114285128 [Camellia sinensis]|uniref:uncharacterized protein LOC114285128 n=1 Tax=Camellia sinensis TaxID=4442 RepID=UPI001036C574|nr:uncharacterized protein LOC114285128 [Camellia sinensis]